MQEQTSPTGRTPEDEPNAPAGPRRRLAHAQASRGSGLERRLANYRRLDEAERQLYEQRLTSCLPRAEAVANRVVRQDGLGWHSDKVRHAAEDALFEALDTFDPGHPKLLGLTDAQALEVWVAYLTDKRVKDAARIATQVRNIHRMDIVLDPDIPTQPAEYGPEEAVLAEMERAEERDYCRQLVAGLPDVDGEVVRLVRLEMCSVAEAAAALGISVSTARRVLHRAIWAMRAFARRDRGEEGA